MKEHRQNQDLVGESLKAEFNDTASEGVPEMFRKLIDNNLKEAFDGTVREGVPDRFTALISELKNVTGENG